MAIIKHNIPGPKGDKGDKGDSIKGDQGIQGLKGDKGDQGESIKGDPGDKGDKGDTGSAGAKGDKGDTGATGVTTIKHASDFVASETASSSFVRVGQDCNGFYAQRWINTYDIEDFQIMNIQAGDTFIYDGLKWRNVTTQLNTTYTGSWQYPVLATVIPASIAVLGDTSTSLLGATSQINYTENTTLRYGSTLQTVSFDNLGYVTGLNLSFTTGLTSLAFPELVYANGTISITATGCSNLSFPKLKYFSGAVSLGTMNSLTSLAFPELLNSEGTLSFASNGLTSVDFTKLESIGSITLTTLTSPITSISFPALKATISGLLSISANAMATLSLPVYAYTQGITISSAQLETISLPALTTHNTTGAFTFTGAKIKTVSIPNFVTMGGTINITNAACPALTTVNIGAIGTTNKLSDITITPNVLEQTSVDGILALVASLDSTINSARTTWGSGRTMTLGGSTPSGTAVVKNQSTGGLVQIAGISGGGGYIQVDCTNHGYQVGDICRIQNATFGPANVAKYVTEVVNANSFRCSVPGITNGNGITGTTTITRYVASEATSNNGGPTGQWSKGVILVRQPTAVTTN